MREDGPRCPPRSWPSTPTPTTRRCSPRARWRALLRRATAWSWCSRPTVARGWRPTSCATTAAWASGGWRRPGGRSAALGVARVEWLGYADSGSGRRARAGRARGHPVLPGPGRGGRRAARRRAAHRTGRPAAVLRRQRRLRPPRPRAGAPGGRARRRDRRHPPRAGGHRAPRHDRAGGARHRPRLPLPRRSSTRPRSSAPSPRARRSPTG